MSKSFSKITKWAEKTFMPEAVKSVVEPVLKSVEETFFPESLKSLSLHDIFFGDETAASAAEITKPEPEAAPVGTLDEKEADEIVKTTAFRRNMFLSPTAFTRGVLSTGQTGRSVLNV